jgi:parallel beta-helix repeat protein
VFDRSSVTIAGDRSRVTGCASFGATGNAIMIRSGVDTRVDHCDISGGQCQGISVMPDPAHPDALVRPVIDHNYVHDWSSVSDPNAHAAISIGECWQNDDIKVGAVVDSNLLERINGVHCALEAKSSGNIIRGNTLLDSKAAIVVRHGSDNIVAGNLVDGSGGIWIRGINTLVAGNTVTNSHGVGLRVLSGNVSADMPTKGYPAASGTVLVGNNVDRLLIGYGYAGSSHPATGTRIEGSQGAAPTLTGLAQDTIEIPAAGETIPTAVRLAAADVGPGGSSALGSVLAGYSGPGASDGNLPVTVVGASAGTPGDQVLAGMAGKGAHSVHPSGNLDMSQALAAMVLAELSALMQQLDAAGI